MSDNEMTVITANILDSRLREVRVAVAAQHMGLPDDPVKARVALDAFRAYEDALFVAPDHVIAWHLVRMAGRMLYKGTPG